jgi:hypothetical protein
MKAEAVKGSQEPQGEVNAGSEMAQKWWKSVKKALKFLEDIEEPWSLSVAEYSNSSPPSKGI